MSGSPLDPLVHLLTTMAIAIGAAALTTLSAVLFLRFLGLHWSWTLPDVLLGPALWPFDPEAAAFIAATAVLASATGARWHADDLRHGGEDAQDARDRRTPLDAHRERRGRRGVRGGRWIDRDGLAVGRDQRRRTVRVPAGGSCGRHTLVVGATGSGKTVTQAWIAGRMIDAGHGAVVIDPKGDELLAFELERAARRARRTFRLWSPEGPGIYNPFAHGTDTELADKILAGETYSEPHYLRQAQRYLGHAVRALRGMGWPVTVATLTDAMVPDKLEWLGRALPDEQAKLVHDYVDGLTAEQRRGLAGTRDRLAILAESDVARFLYRQEPTRHHIDLLRAVQKRDVVLFRLDADRRPLLASMLAAAIVQDLLTIAAEQQRQPVADAGAGRRVLRRRSGRRRPALRPRPLRRPEPGARHAGARRPLPARQPHAGRSGTGEHHDPDRAPPGRAAVRGDPRGRDGHPDRVDADREDRELAPREHPDR